MIEARLESIPVAQQETLSKWLAAEGAGIVVRVVESKVKEHQAKALNAALTAAKGAPAKIEVTTRELELAVRYEHFLDVLGEFQVSKEPVNIVKLS